MEFSNKDIKTIEALWKPIASDIRGNSVKVFMHLFNSYPHYQKMFKSFAHVPKEELPQNKRFQAHTFTAVSALHGIISNLDDEEMVTEMLMKVGENHSRRDIHASDFKNFAQDLTNLMEEVSGDAWTIEAHSTWDKLMKLVLTKIEGGTV